MNNQELWEAILGEVELSLTKASFTTWFKNTSIKDLSEDTLTVIVPNIFAKEWLEKKYQKIILNSIRKHFPKINRVVCSLENQNTQPVQQKSMDSVVVKSISNKIPTEIIRKTPDFNQNSNRVHSGLNPRYKFETYVVGSNNELAYAACQSVSKNPGESYNPLFIYGDVGLGKTHLIQATGNFIKKQNPGFSFNNFRIQAL
jgi:chromosomal replication initiator protein